MQIKKQLFKTEEKEIDTKYSRSTKTPHYNVNPIMPVIDELYNFKKYSELIKKINESSVSEEEKKFLKLAASRHIVFNYSKIADYYAGASKEMQELMEDSALVIIDIEDAIANGYVELSKRIKEIVIENKVVKEENSDE